MALRFVEGFERYGSAPGAPTGLATKYSESGGNSNTALITGRIGGLGLKVHMAPSGSPHIVPATFGNLQTWIIGFGLKTGTELIATRIFSLYDSTSEQFALRMTAAGELVLYRGTTIITGGTSAPGVLVTDAWHYIEIKVTIGDPGVGNYELRVAGVNILSDANEDTKQTANAYAQTIRFLGAFNSDPDTQFAFDDIYICDTTGSVNNDFLGPKRVVVIFSDGAGDSTDFTPSAGSNYQAVDDNPHDTDTTYVESGTATDRDLYTFGNVSLVNISGIQISAICRDTDASPFDIKLVAKSGSTTDAGSAQTVGSVGYVTRSRILEENPDTSAAWTDSEIDAAQFGIEVG